MRILKLIVRYVQLIYYKILFQNFGLHSVVRSPLRIDGSKNIFIGNYCIIEYKTWLAANPLTDAQECALVIMDGCTIGHFNHIYATGKIVIEKNVLTADRVYISDNLHGYEDITKPIKEQRIKQNGQVVIGAGSWLGENVCVLGASIGRNWVIGANSVVTHDIPDYCVAVGIPAKVIKKYDFINKKWIKI